MINIITNSTEYISLLKHKQLYFFIYCKIQNKQIQHQLRSILLNLFRLSLFPKLLYLNLKQIFKTFLKRCFLYIYKTYTIKYNA